MELNSLDMPSLLAELGVNYDPDRLADALRDRPWDVRKRALRIAATLGSFLTSLLQVSRAGAPVAVLSADPVRTHDVRNEKSCSGNGAGLQGLGF